MEEEKKVILTADKMKEYREKKIKNIKSNKTYLEFLKYVEKKMYDAIDANPCISMVCILVPDNINISIIHDILTDDYGYQVKLEKNTHSIYIILDD